MKRTFFALVVTLLAMLIAMPAPIHAQDGGDGDDDTGGAPTGNLIAYGDSLSGSITNAEFEQVYTFEGSADDLVIISMTAQNSEFDTYLYLTTLDNEILAQNDDFGYNYYNATIIATLPESGSYQIVATRYSGRGGSGTGSYDLSLTLGNPVSLGVTFEGTATYGEGTDINIFIPQASGVYTVDYTLVTGNNRPDVTVTLLDGENGYDEEIAAVGGRGMTSASFSIFLEEGNLYNFGLRDSYYDYSVNFGDTGTYTMVIQAAE